MMERLSRVCILCHKFAHALGVSVFAKVHGGSRHPCFFRFPCRMGNQLHNRFPPLAGGTCRRGTTRLLALLLFRRLLAAVLLSVPSR
jgi:hypothetical protein